MGNYETKRPPMLVFPKRFLRVHSVLRPSVSAFPEIYLFASA